MRRDISELKLRLRWLRRRKPWRGRCRVKVYENDTVFLVQNARVASSLWKYVCSIKFPTLNIYISLVLFLISLSNINSGQRVCRASKYRRSSRGSRESRQSCVRYPVAAWSIVSIRETFDRARKIGGKKNANANMREETERDGKEKYVLDDVESNKDIPEGQPCARMWCGRPHG